MRGDTIQTWMIGSNELFYYYTCPRWLYFQMHSGTDYNPHRERAIEEDRIGELKQYLGEWSGVDVEWNSKLTSIAIQERHSILRVKASWLEGRILMVATPHALFFDYPGSEENSYAQVMVRFSRKNLPRHRMQASWNHYVLEKNAISLWDHDLFYYRQSLTPLIPEEDVSVFLERLHTLLCADDPPERMDPGRFCNLCPYQKACNHDQMKMIHTASTRHLRGVGEKMAHSLEEKQVFNITDMARMEITEEIQKEHKGIEKIKLQSHAFLGNQALLVGDPVELLPQYPKGELYFDIEADQYPYLFGVYDPQKDEYRSFIAADENDLPEVGRELILFFQESSSVVYHYYDYEIRVMKLIEAMSGLALDQVAFFDVYECLRQCVVLPLKEYSLKSVSKWLGYEWTVNLDGRTSIVEYRRWKDTGNPMHLEAILKYNEDDCRSTALVKRWLEGPGDFENAYRKVCHEEVHQLLFETKKQD